MELQDQARRLDEKAYQQDVKGIVQAKDERTPLTADDIAHRDVMDRGTLADIKPVEAPAPDPEPPVVEEPPKEVAPEPPAPVEEVPAEVVP